MILSDTEVDTSVLPDYVLAMTPIACDRWLQHQPGAKLVIDEDLVLMRGLKHCYKFP